MHSPWCVTLHTPEVREEWKMHNQCCHTWIRPLRFPVHIILIQQRFCVIWIIPCRHLSVIVFIWFLLMQSAQFRPEHRKLFVTWNTMFSLTPLWLSSISLISVPFRLGYYFFWYATIIWLFSFGGKQGISGHVETLRGALNDLELPTADAMDFLHIKGGAVAALEISEVAATGKMSWKMSCCCFLQVLVLFWWCLPPLCSNLLQ